MTDKIKNILLIILGVLLLVALGVGGFFFFQKEQMRQNAEEARVEAQNKLAQMSQTMQETEQIWSRLAQEKEVDMNALRAQNEELARLIEERDEEITTLTNATANLRPVRVVIRDASQTEPEEGRLRVDFDQIHDEFWRVQGFTLTNPAEAEVSVSWTRPANFTIITTQQPDLSWRSYLESDIPGLEIGSIESTVNPLSRPQEAVPWHHGIFVGLNGLVGVSGNSGAAALEAGYDAGDFEFSIQGGGIVYPGAVDFAAGLSLRLNPFAL